MRIEGRGRLQKTVILTNDEAEKLLTQLKGAQDDIAELYSGPDDNFPMLWELIDGLERGLAIARHPSSVETESRHPLRW